MRVFCSILILLIGSFSLRADDAFVVRLETEEQLPPLYLSLSLQDNSLTPQQLASLKKVLDFDLSYNGSNSLLPSNSSLDQLLHAGSVTSKEISLLKENGAQYAVIGSIKDKILTTQVLSLNKQLAQTAPPITLTGDLSKDRQSLHKLSDAIHLSLYKKPGIACSKILYALKSRNGQDSSSWTSDIWECDYDGANARQVTHQNALAVTPSYLPTPQGNATDHFFYVSYVTGQPKIQLARLSDGKGKPFSKLTGSQLMPALSHQRDKIAFISDTSGRPDLFLQGFNTQTGETNKPQQLFSARNSTQGSPTFSPDGKKIAFVSNKDGSPRIYILPIPAPGADYKDLKPQLISRVNRENSAPSWSPDGKMIAYCALTNGVRQIWIYTLATGEEHQLTMGPQNKENPSWASDSLHLVYNSADADKSELFLINLNQPKALSLTSGKGEKRFPSFSP